MDALIKKDIESDFESCIACFYNVEIIMKNFSRIMEKKDELDFAQNINFDNVLEKQKAEIITLLGRVCELAFKYLLKIKQMQIYPNLNYEQFSKNQVIYSANSIKDLKNKKYISEADVDEILSIKDDIDRKKFHNFSYLSTIVEKLMPETFANLKKYYEYFYCSKLAFLKYKELKKEHNLEFGDYLLESIIFPADSIIIDDHDDVKKINDFKSKMVNVQKQSGDAFVRLRYFSNNLDNKKYKIGTMYDYAKVIVSFILGIHNNNDNLLVNPEFVFSHEMAIRYANLIGRDKDEINAIFSDFHGDNDFHDLKLRLFSGYSLNEMEKIEKECKKLKCSIFKVYNEGYTVDELKLFYSIGWNDPNIMQEFIFDNKGNRRTIEQISNLVKKTRTMVGDDGIKVFFDYGIFNPMIMLRYMYDEYGTKRSIEQIQYLLNRKIR